MRIVHVSPADIQGGAARGAYGLHRALRDLGLDSIMLVQRKYSDDASVVAKRGERGKVVAGLRERLDRLPLNFYRWEQENWWTVGWMPYDLRDAVDRLAPDLLHFHGAGRGAAPIETLAQLRRYPMVWTLRDLWALTGGCHYTSGCERYLEGCGTCPQLGSRNTADLSRWHWARKQRAWRDLPVAFVGLSEWMADCARRSPLTGRYPITVIPNGIDTTRFHPEAKATYRADLGLPQDKWIVLYGAMHATTDPRKGFRQLRDAAAQLARTAWRERLHVVVFGNDDTPPPFDLPTTYLGRISGDAMLARLYATADAMVVPSIEEAFGKTAAEAMACGTPVVGFANTGLLDIVDHRVNGYLAETGSAPDLARGIVWTIQQAAEDPAIGERARAKILRDFDSRTVARRYERLYRDWIAEHAGAPVAAEAAQ